MSFSRRSSLIDRITFLVNEAESVANTASTDLQAEASMLVLETLQECRELAVLAAARATTGSIH